MAPQFIRVLQLELSFDNNIPTQYFRFNHKLKKTIVLRSGMKMREVIKKDKFKTIMLTMTIKKIT
jgi:hypothetical protein